MLELKRPLNNLKKNIYGFQDMSANADNTFKITDLPDKFLLGKNSFKLHLKEDVLVLRSQVYIDIIDSFGNSIYYKILSDNLPNKERIVVVYIYDTTPVGDCEIIIAGRLLKNPNTGESIPFSNEVSSPDYHGVPNVVWRGVVQINPQESENRIYYSIPPTVTYSEIRKPKFQLSSENRLVFSYPTSSAKATLYSDRGQLTTLDQIKNPTGKLEGHLIPQGSGSMTFDPITPIYNGNEVASMYFSGYELSSSMEGGRIYFNNIPVSYPRDASVTQSIILNYSASIVKVLDLNTCFVSPPFYKTLEYRDNNGNTKTLVLDGFREVGGFTSSYYRNIDLTVDSSSFNSYIKLEIENAEPEIGSVKSISVRAKSINNPGQSFDLGVYDIEQKQNIMTVGSDSYTMTPTGIKPLGLGDFRKLDNPSTYWTGSRSDNGDIEFLVDRNVIDGVIIPNRDIYDVGQYSEFYIRPEYQPTVKKGTEYELTFDFYYPRQPIILEPRQLDIYISGSSIETNHEIQKNSPHPPFKDSKFGKYIGTVSAVETRRHSPSFYFTATETGKITPRFVQRSTGAVYSNIQIVPRNEPGYSPKSIELEVPLPVEFQERTEIGIELDYFNSKDERANYGTSLYGVLFDGNTPTSTSGGNGIYGGSGESPDDTTASLKTFKFITSDDPVYNPDQFSSQILFGAGYTITTGDFYKIPGAIEIVAGNPVEASIYGLSKVKISGEERSITVESYNPVGDYSQFIISPGYITFGRQDYNTGEGFAEVYDINGAYFIDSRTDKRGKEYESDYSTGIIANVRSITDVGTVRKMFKSASLFSSSQQVQYAQISGIPSSSLTGSASSGQVAVWRSGSISGSNNLYYNDLGLGIGTNQVPYPLVFSKEKAVDQGGIALYSTKNQTSNYQRGRIYLTSGNLMSYNLEAAGTGSVGYHRWQINGSSVLEVDSAQAVFYGGFLTGTDNNKDMGRLSSSPFRFRSIYLGTSIQAGAPANTPIAATFHGVGINNSSSSFVAKFQNSQSLDLFSVRNDGRVTITGSIDMFGNLYLGTPATGTLIMSNNITGGTSNPATVFDTLGNYWGNSQVVYSFRENGVEFFTIDGIGNIRAPQGSFVTTNTTPESGVDTFIGHGMRRNNTTAGFNFAWGESISSITEPGMDLFPVAGTHISGGLLFRLSKDSSRTQVAFLIDGMGNQFISGSGNFGGNLTITGSAFVSGNFGVNTINPLTAFHINGDSSQRFLDITIQDTYASNPKTWKIGNSSLVGKLGISDNNVYRMVIDGSGNMGIGKSTPIYKLDVSGSGNFDGNLTVSGSLNVNSLAGLEFPSSSLVNKVRLKSNVGLEQGMSSSFWTTNYTVVSQSIHTVNIKNNTINLTLPIMRGNDTNTPITTSIHHASYAVQVLLNIYALTGSLASPRDSYSWASTTQFRFHINPKFGAISASISALHYVTSSNFLGVGTSNLGSYGGGFPNRTNLNDWHTIRSASYVGGDSVKFEIGLAPTSSFNWTAYVGMKVDVLKHEIGVV